MMSETRHKYLITLICALISIGVAFGIHFFAGEKGSEKRIKAGFIYVGDAGDAYTNNFLKAQLEIEKQFSEQVEIIAKYNVPEDTVEPALIELVRAECDIIFTTSYGYGEKAKEYAAAYPEIQFCAATCSNADEEPYLSNYHTFMGNIYEGRYVSGVVAGMKLKELIEDGKITAEQAKIGYIAAFPYAEVISGYTAFFLGVRSEVPEAVMTVKYTIKAFQLLLLKNAIQKLLNSGTNTMISCADLILLSTKYLRQSLRMI